MSWKDAGFVLASKNRKSIVTKLTVPRTPTFLAKDLDMNIANVSRTLAELEKKEIVVCLTPRQKVGKIYTLTKKGKSVLAKMREMES